MKPENSPFADAADDTVNPNPTPSEGLAMEHMGFFAFWLKLTFQPAAFFRENFRPREWPHFGIGILLLGFSAGISRVDQQLLKRWHNGELEQLGFLGESWSGYGLLVAYAGILAAPFYFYLGGLLYDFRIAWCGGQIDYSRARFLYLYSLAYPMLFGVAAKVSDVIHNPEWPSILAPVSLQPVTLVLQLVGVHATYWSILVSYRGVREITSVRRRPAIFSFIICPAIYYTLGLAALIAAALVKP